MKKMKKLFAVILSLAMVLGMSVTAFAAGTGETYSDGYNRKPIATPSGSDEVTVEIQGIMKEADSEIEEKVTVTLYKVAEAEYGGTGNNSVIGYKWLNGITFENEKQPTSQEIANIANNIATKGFTVADTKDNVAGTYTASVPAGAYIAIITGSTNKYVYNPILLTATYQATEDADGNVTGTEMLGGVINANDAHYIWGETAVAKRTEPTLDKTITGGTVKDEQIPDTNLKFSDDVDQTGVVNRQETASVGDRIQFQLQPTVPVYPVNAVNKTFFISDKMEVGLDFDISSLEISINKENGEAAYTNLTVRTAEGESTIPKEYSGVISFLDGDKVVARATKVDNGFNVNFTYDNLINDPATGTVYTPTVKYSAILTDEAKVGPEGIETNKNTATLYYAKNPNSGQNYDEITSDLPTGDDYETKQDREVVRTYQLAFHKVGEGKEANGLEGAVFGIYSDEACENLIDQVTTDAHGYAVSSKVGAGTYYIKEIKAPAGYSLNETVYKAEANWTSAKTEITETVTKREYTADKNEAKDGENAVQVGWLWVDPANETHTVFYAMSAYTEETKTDNVFAAYLKSETTISTSKVEEVFNEEAGGGTVTQLYAKDANGNWAEAATDTITNTKLSNLPSTGGIGTTIFTIGGCLIMVIAAALFFASRRKAAK